MFNSLLLHPALFELDGRDIEASHHQNVSVALIAKVFDEIRQLQLAQLLLQSADLGQTFLASP
jgi:hypothetical protein